VAVENLGGIVWTKIASGFNVFIKRRVEYLLKEAFSSIIGAGRYEKVKNRRDQ
jgi:hypothetical protein